MKAAAEAASKALISIINPHAVYTILGYLFECMDAKKHPATKEASLLLVKQLVGMHPKQITRALPDIVPAVSGCMNDSKQSVKVSREGVCMEWDLDGGWGWGAAKARFEKGIGVRVMQMVSRTRGSRFLRGGWLGPKHARCGDLRHCSTRCDNHAACPSVCRLPQDVATETMKEACTLVGNRDINAMVPLIIRSINHPEEVQETVHKLASTTFVQAVSRGAWYLASERDLTC